MGAIGILLFCCTILATARAISRKSLSRVAAGGLTGAMIAAMTIMSVSFGAWQSWWLATLWIVVAASSMVVDRERAP